MSYPTPHSIELLPYQPMAADSHGNARPAWGDPVTLPVIALVLGPSTEPREASRDAVVSQLQVYLPNGYAVGPHDKVVALGKTYDVQGEPEDFNYGPWWQPGARVVNATRVEG